jgi:hypothetical protein
MKRIVVVGAGPQSLAVLLRLFSNKSLYTDTEMTTEKKYWHHKTLNIDLESVLVIDPQGWLGCWKTKLEKQQLEYLRSPLFFHPGKKKTLSTLTLQTPSTMQPSMSMLTAQDALQSSFG